jgi:hypothetical protein
VHIGADLHAAQRTVQRACDAQPEQVLIVTAAGYGTYGRDRHRLRLDVLCAMHQVAETHQVSLRTVGDWLDAEGATTDIDPQTIAEQFTIAYIGPFASELAYTKHRMGELGWTQALQAAAIPEDYLNTAAINRDWFAHQVRQIDSGVHGRIEVFHRASELTNATAAVRRSNSPPIAATRPGAGPARLCNGSVPAYHERPIPRRRNAAWRHKQRPTRTSSRRDIVMTIEANPT